MEWVVAVAAASMLAGYGLAWGRSARRRSRLADEAARHELVVARLRGELTASVSAVVRARADAESARASMHEALVESGRLQQRLAEQQAASVALSDHEALALSAQALRDEVDALHRELDTLSPVIEELGYHRAYVESLQRELVYRDERLLALEDQQHAIAPRPAGALRRIRNGVRRAPEADPIIDLTGHRDAPETDTDVAAADVAVNVGGAERREPASDRPAPSTGNGALVGANGNGHGTNGTNGNAGPTSAATGPGATAAEPSGIEVAGPGGPGSGQWGHDRVEQPGVHEAVERSTGHG